MTTTEQTPTAPLPAVGTVITARPWQRARRAVKPARGLVLLHRGAADGFLVVWFPSLGAPVLTNPGGSVMGVFGPEVESVIPLDQLPATWVIDAERAARTARRTGGYDIGRAAGWPLETLARAHRATRNATRRTRP